MTNKAKDIVLFSTADWDNPFWTNKQHMAVQFAKRGYRVFYIESVGLRRPTAAKSDFTRILRRLVSGLRPPRKVRENIWVWSPLVIPFQSNALVRGINRSIFRAFTWFWPKVLGLRPTWLWTYNPLTTAFLSTSGFQTVIYHCVDEIKAQPGMPAEAIQRGEEDLLRKCHLCFVTAPDLLPGRQAIQPNTFYHSNVADFDHFNRAMAQETPLLNVLASIPEPRVAFVGAISSYKVNFELLINAADQLPHVSFVLAGKVGEGEPNTNADKLRDRKNIHLIGPVDYAMLPSLLKGCRVAILPSNLNDYTAGMFPMKFYEYLASGLPVVSTALPALREQEDVAEIAADEEAFISGIRKYIGNPNSSLERRIARAKENTYDGRTERMLEQIARLVGTKHED